MKVTTLITTIQTAYDAIFPFVLHFSQLSLDFLLSAMRTSFKPIHTLKLKRMAENVVYTSSKKTSCFAEILVAHAKPVPLIRIV